MKFNTKTRYGLRAMIEIARETNNNGIFQKDISERQKISNKYLDHIIYALKVAGLIANVKGKKSGYILTQKPEEITLYDIYRAFEPDISIVDCLSENIHCPDENLCAPRDFWLGLNTQIIEYLTRYTLKDLVEKQLAYNSQTRNGLQQEEGG